MLQFLSLWIQVQKSNWATHWEIQEMLFITETHGLKKTILRNYLHIVFERNANRNSPASAHPSGMLTMSSLFGFWNLPLNKHDKSSEQKTPWQTLIRERESGRSNHPFHNISNEPEARGVLRVRFPAELQGSPASPHVGKSGSSVQLLCRPSHFLLNISCYRI